MRNRILTLCLASTLFACGGEEEASSSSSAAAEGRRVAIEVGAHGYEPSQVEARAGEPLTLVFKRTTEAGCGHELVIPSQDIERELPLGEEVAVTFTPSEAGELRFTCGMDMYDGAVVVQ